jgi:hypothetical protein
VQIKAEDGGGDGLIQPCPKEPYYRYLRTGYNFYAPEGGFWNWAIRTTGYGSLVDNGFESVPGSPIKMGSGPGGSAIGLIMEPDVGVCYVWKASK